MRDSTGTAALVLYSSDIFVHADANSPSISTLKLSLSLSPSREIRNRRRRRLGSNHREPAIVAKRRYRVDFRDTCYTLIWARAFAGHFRRVSNCYSPRRRRQIMMISSCIPDDNQLAAVPVIDAPDFSVGATSNDNPAWRPVHLSASSVRVKYANKHVFCRDKHYSPSPELSCDSNSIRDNC